MKCLTCKCIVPDGSSFCMHCGAKLLTDRRVKVRGNGDGSVYKRGKTWTAEITCGWTDEGKRISKSKGGFPTKKAASDYLNALRTEAGRPVLTFRELYEKWRPTHRAGESAMRGYQAAFRYFAPLADMKVPEITVDDLQECIDNCRQGKRTRQNMKTLAGLLYKFAIPRNLATVNMGTYLVAHGESGPGKDGLPMDAVHRLFNSGIPFADYIVCDCYLGFRPSEFLALNISDYHDGIFIGGSKTEAGRNRMVPVAPVIRPLVERIIGGRTEGPVFCDENGGRISYETYREKFYQTLDRCGIENPDRVSNGRTYKTYTPHSCRHTFATLLKSVDAPEKDKLKIIGHTSGEMLRYYQDVSPDDLRKVVRDMRL